MIAIAVTSGKGGVGKSTVSLNLALALLERGSSVGVLDADFYGPDIPLMVNLKRTIPLERWMLGRSLGREPLTLEPVERYGLKLMSVGFLIGEDQALSMPAQLLHGALRQLLANVEWGELDVLVIDMPPGTADLQQQLLDLVDLGGALIVVGPQDVAHLDGRKVLDMLSSAGVRVLGGVENMAGLDLPALRRDRRGLPSGTQGAVALGGGRHPPRLAAARSGGRPCGRPRQAGLPLRPHRNRRDRVPRARRRGRRRTRVA